MTRGLRRMPAVLVAVVFAGFGVTGCGGPNRDAEIKAPVPVNAARPAPEASSADEAAQEVIQADGGLEEPGEQKRVKPTQQSLAPAEQPEKAYATPSLPEGPEESASELDRLEHELAKVVWTAAGVVDEDADTDCEVSESTLIEVGEYSFDCEVTSSGVDVDLAVTVEITADRVLWKYRGSWLPVSERKAVYEATRQSFKPARVTCDIVGVELVRVEKTDGLTCWVTDVHNQRTAYRGELLADESSPLVFRPVK